MISAIQIKWPTKRILIGKTELDAAYHQIHANAKTVSTCIAIVDKLSFLCLWLPFGNTPTPADYTTIRKVAIDLGKYLLRYESWDTTCLNSPHSNLPPEEGKTQSEDHLEKADSLAVNINSKETSMDGFIDDIIIITVHDKYWIEHAKRAALLVIRTLFGPLQASEPLECDDPLSLRKIAGKRKLVKSKTCLGWYINTHALRLFMPK